MTSPELAAHKRAIAASNASFRKWDEDERFDELARLCGILTSHAISAHEAAWRSDNELLARHLSHAAGALKLALKVSRE